MKGRKLYAAALILGVIFSAYFFYIKDFMLPVREESALALTRPQEERIFPHPDKTFYEMEVYLDTNQNIIHGQTVLTTVNTSGQDIGELCFTVYPNAFAEKDKTPAPGGAYYAGFDEGWLKVSWIKINGKETVFVAKGVNLTVILLEKIEPGQEIKVEMDWQARVPSLAYRYGSRNGVFMLSNFYPALNVLGREGWHKAENYPFGDPFCFHSANYVVSLNIPEPYDIISTGVAKQIEAGEKGRRKYIIEAQNVRDFCLVVMYHYKEFGLSSKTADIRLYIPPSHEKNAEYILKEAASIIDFYSATFCSYPYAEFKIVFVPMQGFHGMEYSGLIFLQEDFLKPEFGGERAEFILAHEIAHQWWYGIVGNDQVREPWLDEGLANWSAYKYRIKIKNEKLPPHRLSKEVNLARELKEIYSRQDYYQTAYYGGEAFWWGLEEILGEDVVYNILRHYLAQYKYRIASTQALFQIIESEAGRDMQDYFARWFKPE